VLLVPAFNEGSVIHKGLSEACAEFRWVVCVDDGSGDDTAEQARSAGAIVLSHPLNLGQGAALQTAIEYSLRLPVDWFCSFDADGQHSLEDVITMREAALSSKPDVVLGSRFLGEAKNMPTMRRRLLRLAVRFTVIMSRVKVTDTHNGLRLFNRRVAESINLEEPGFAHASEFIDKIGRFGFHFIEVPVTIDYSEYSKRKGQPMLNAVNIAADTITAKVLQR